MLHLTLIHLLWVRPATGKQSSSVLMLSCLLRKRLYLCKLKQLRSVPISSDWRLPAHRPVSTSIGLPLLWDRFPPSPARQGVPQSSQPLKQGRTMAGSLQHSQVAQKVLRRCSNCRAQMKDSATHREGRGAVNALGRFCRFQVTFPVSVGCRCCS